MLTPEVKVEGGGLRITLLAQTQTPLFDFCNLSSLINVASLICYFISNELLWKIKLQMSPLVMEKAPTNFQD